MHDRPVRLAGPLERGPVVRTDLHLVLPSFKVFDIGVL